MVIAVVIALTAVVMVMVVVAHPHHSTNSSLIAHQDPSIPFSAPPVALLRAGDFLDQ